MKTAFVMIAVLAAAACQSDTKNLEKKIYDLGKKIDALARNGAGAQQLQQRPGPDPTKTYAVPIEGDPFDGPAHLALGRLLDRSGDAAGARREGAAALAILPRNGDALSLAKDGSRPTQTRTPPVRTSGAVR